MPARLRLFYGTLTGALLLIPCLGLYREIVQRDDIWWTPPQLAVSLAESQTRVEIYIRGKSLGALLNAGQLRIADEAGPDGLGAADVSFRFNNWDRVRARRLPMLLAYGAAMGAGLVLLILIVSGRLAFRSERQPVAA
jgi:hypothetical protein